MVREPTVLIVSESPQLVRQLVRWLTAERWSVRSAKSMDTAVQLVARTAPDIIVLDVPSERDRTQTIIGELARITGGWLTPVLLTLNGNREGLWSIASALEIYDVVAGPLDPQEIITRARSLLRQKQHIEERDTVENVIRSLALVVEARDPYTRGHSLRLAGYATVFASRLGLQVEEADCLRRGAFLHDIGKIGVPDSVLLKPARLEPHEYAVVKSHTLIGDLLCSKLNSLRGLRPIIRNHHERLDGSGYPDGLKHDAIPLLAQVTSIVDIYDALTTDRPYRPAWPIARAHEELVGEAARGWRRRDLVEEFVQLSSEGGLPPEATFEEIELHVSQRGRSEGSESVVESPQPAQRAHRPRRGLPERRKSARSSRVRLKDRRH